jgi:hypothetical protein
MKPKFGRLTQFLAAAFALTGLGSGFAALNSGSQTTPGTQDIPYVLFGIAIVALVIAAGLFVEEVWAWWAGVSTALLTVGGSAILGRPVGEYFIWLLFVGCFVISGVQGLRGSRRQIGDLREGGLQR